MCVDNGPIQIEGKLFPTFYIPEDRIMFDENFPELEAGDQRRTSQSRHDCVKRNFLHAFFDIDASGDFYKGEFVLNERMEFVRWGPGVMHYANGSVYEG